MKFTLTTTLGMLAVASASHVKMHFPRANSTASAVDSSSQFPTAPKTTEIHPTQPSMTPKVTQEVSTKTITITLGSGTDKTVKTSVVPVTIDKTITVAAEATGQDEQTSTTTSTTTSTRTVTVVRAEASSPANGGSGGASGDKVTVTVTAPASTVYVTLPCTQNQATALPTGQVNNAAVPDNSNDKSGSSGNESEEPCPDATTTLQLTTTVSSTVLVKPYPTGGHNGTSTGGTAKPSGFARLRR